MYGTRTYFTSFPTASERALATTPVEWMSLTMVYVSLVHTLLPVGEDSCTNFTSIFHCYQNVWLVIDWRVDAALCLNGVFEVHV